MPLRCPLTADTCPAFPLLQGPHDHGVYVPGFCLAEASNHWHPVCSSRGGQLEGWLAQWRQMADRCPAAWQERMGKLWASFARLQRFGELAQPLAALLATQPQSSG